MPRTYLFYDIETTGLNKAFDQILTFAAVRTDEQLEEIERHHLRVRLRPDVVPSPAAVITNRIGRAQWAEGMSECEAVGLIHRWVNQPGTVSIGYNSLGFDDEFLRFAFYRNLLPPYTHQYRNGCRRMDLFPIAVLYWLYRPEVLRWPEADGKPSLKLEDLAAANRLLAGPAHDAAADVAATLALARRFQSRPRMWRYAHGCFSKTVDSRRAAELPVRLEGAAGPHRLGLMVAGEFGAANNFQAPVLSLGDSIPYPNQSLWLRLDEESLPRTQAAEPEQTTWVVRKRFGEPGILLPPRPRYWRRIGAERDRRAAENLRWLETHPAELEAVARHWRNFRYPFIPQLDADAALYQAGFLPRPDERLADKFRRAAPEQRLRLVERFQSPEARTLAVRVIGRNFPEHLAGPWAEEFAAYLKRVNPPPGEPPITDYAGRPRTTPAAALAELRRLRAEPSLDHRQRELLDELEAHILETFGDPGA